MRLISDVIIKSKECISKEELKKYFSIDELKEDVRPLTILYYFNSCGFYIPYKPSICINSLDTLEGWIELAKGDKKLEYHDNDGTLSMNGDIAINDFHIIKDNEQVLSFIRIPDRYIYTCIHLNAKKKAMVKSNLTGEDLHMLNDSNNEIEISICDLHEDGA